MRVLVRRFTRGLNVAAGCLLALAASSAADARPEDALERAARMERARRARIDGHAAVVTTEDLERHPALEAYAAAMTLATSSNVVARDLAPPPGRPPVAGENASPAKAPPKPRPPAKAPAAKPSPAHGERYWRERAEAARKLVSDLEGDLEWTKQRVMILRMDLVVPGNPAREFNRSADLEALMKEQAAIERELAAARAEPDRIREEGRREGAPPGWFR